MLLHSVLKFPRGTPKPGHAQLWTRHSPLRVKVGVYVGMRGTGHGEVAAPGVNENLKLLCLRGDKRDQQVT